MSDIVYVHTEKAPRPKFKSHGGLRYPTDNKVTIFQSPGKVAAVSSTLIIGRASRTSDKQYAQWRTTASQGLRRNSNGTVVPFYVTRRWDSKVGTPWKHHVPTTAVDNLTYESSDEFFEAYRAACRSEFDITSMHDLYPISEEYGLISYKSIPAFFRNDMRSSNMNEFTTRVFGKSRTNQRLVSAVANTDPYIVAIAHQFRGLVDDREITHFLENTKFDKAMEEKYDGHTPHIRKFVRAIGVPSRSNLLQRGLTLGDMYYLSQAYQRQYRLLSLNGTTFYKTWGNVFVA